LAAVGAVQIFQIHGLRIDFYDAFTVASRTYAIINVVGAAIAAQDSTFGLAYFAIDKAAVSHRRSPFDTARMRFPASVIDHTSSR
jgi:hypothetical protein